MSGATLSVVCMLGSHRERLPRLSAALAAQTAVDEMELVLVGGDGTPPFGDGMPWKQVPWPPGGSYGEARAEAARQAEREIVACLLDHFYPDPGWADALIRTYRERPWAAVGYGFRNANPTTYSSRATFLAHFGPWASAGSEESAVLPGNDISYRRRELLTLGSDLGALLDIDA